MALSMGQLELYPGYDTIGVRSHFSGDDEHYAVLEVVGKSKFDMVRDMRDEYYSGGAFRTNEFKYQNRAVAFFLQPQTLYTVNIHYYDLGGNHIDTVSSVTSTKDDSPPSSGAQYWVSSTGNDSNPGTSAAPFRTIQHAVDIVQYGDTIWVAPGTYPGQVIIDKSGLPNNYITIRATDPNNKPVISVGDVRGAFRTNEASYWRFKYLDVRADGWDADAFYLLGASVGNIIEDCRIELFNVGSWNSGGVWMNGRNYSQGPQDTIVQRNIIITNQTGGSGPFAVMLYWRCRGNFIRYNDIQGKFYDAVGSGGNNDMEGGLYMDSHVYGNRCDPTADDAWELEGGGLNCSCWDNTCEYPWVAGIGIAQIAIGPTYVFRNILNRCRQVCFKCGSTSYGFVEIFHNSGTAGQAAYAGYGNNAIIHNHRLRNNILWATGGSQYCMECSSPDISIETDYNLFNSARGDCFKWASQTTYTYANWKSLSGNEDHGRFGDPLFYDRANGDFRLQDGSPAVNGGLIIPGFNDASSPWPFQGAAPDMGAIESGIAGAPLAAFEASPASGDVPLTVSFQNKSTGAIDSFHWDFGDGQTSTETSPTHIYNQPGSFAAVLTANGPGGSSEASLVIEVTQTYTLSIVADTGGTTDPEPGDYQVKGTVLLTALPDTDYKFAGWEIDGSIVSTDYTYGLFMDGDKIVTARFEYVEPQPDRHVVTISVLGGGITSPNPGDMEVDDGELLQITAYAAQGWEFDHWEGDVSGTDESISFFVNSNMSVVAVFVEETGGGGSLVVPLVVGIGSVAAVLSTIAWVTRIKR